MFARHSANELRRRSAESHLHKRFVLVVSLETAGTMMVDGVPFELEPGEAQLIFPQSYHHFPSLAASRLLWLFITFETAEPEKLLLLRHETLQMESSDIVRMKELLTHFQNHQQSKNRDAICARLSQLLCDWCHALAEGCGEGGGAFSPKNSNFWTRLTQQLDELSPEELRVAPLAKRLNISERHLRTKFQLHFQVSIGSYLRNYRLRRAIGLMTSSELTLAEIADRCGYRSLSSFCRAFEKETGESPARFRKR